MQYRSDPSSSHCWGLLEDIGKHFQDVLITFKPDPKAVEILEAILKYQGDPKARIEWGRPICCGLKEMAKDFIKEFSNPL